MNGYIFLVNPSHPLSGGFDQPELSPSLPGSGVLLESVCARALTALIKDIGAEGKIVPVSGWRSHSEQVSLWNETSRTHGEEFTRQYVALPGCSEHETGLAIDLALNTGGEIDFIRPYFPYDGVCGEFRRRAAGFGFIERYPAGKEHITGISAEPWHFRYVGAAHAEYIAGHGLTLEEYIALLAAHPGEWLDTGPARVSFIPGGAGLPAGEYMPEDSNAGGSIITTWRSRA